MVAVPAYSETLYSGMIVIPPCSEKVKAGKVVVPHYDGLR
jgi:hypothetical protein